MLNRSVPEAREAMGAQVACVLEQLEPVVGPLPNATILGLSDSSANSEAPLRFCQGGPLRLRGVELDLPDTVDSVMEMLEGTWVNNKHRCHVRSCLQLAKDQRQDVVNRQYIFRRSPATCGGRTSEVYLSQVVIKKTNTREKSTLMSMSSAEVAKIVGTMGVGWCSKYAEYASSFLRNGVDGKLLNELSSEDLEELGVDSPLHRKRLILEINSLKQPRSVDSFDIVICSVGFANGGCTYSKEDVEVMLEEELRRAAEQLAALEAGELAPQKASTPRICGEISTIARAEQKRILHTEVSDTLLVPQLESGGQKGTPEASRWLGADSAEVFAKAAGKDLSLEATRQPSENTVNLHAQFMEPLQMAKSPSSCDAQSNEGGDSTAVGFDSTTGPAMESGFAADVGETSAVDGSVHPVSQEELAWRPGDRVCYFACGRSEAPVEGVVEKVHDNGCWVKVRYSDARGGTELTPWLRQGARLHRL